MLGLLEGCWNDDKSTLGQRRLKEDVLPLDVDGRLLIFFDLLEPVPPVLLHMHDMEAGDEKILILTKFTDVVLRKLGDNSMEILKFYMMSQFD